MASLLPTGGTDLGLKDGRAMQTQRRAQDFDKVVVSCSEALRLHPTNVDALYRRASAYLKQGATRACLLSMEADVGRTHVWG